LCLTLAHHSTVSKAVSHSIRRIATGIDRKAALQFVMSGPVQEITDRNHSSRPPSEKDQLASRSTLAKQLGHGIKFSSSIAQVMVRNAKVHSLQPSMAGKENPVGGVPKSMFGKIGQNLSSSRARDQHRHENKPKSYAPSHEPNLKVAGRAIQIT